MKKLRQIIPEGEVVGFPKPHKNEKSGPFATHIRFKQIFGDIVKHVKSKHPHIAAMLKDKPKYASEIHTHGVHSGYMFNFVHKDAAGKEYEADKAYDLKGNKLPFQRIPISDVFK